MGQPRSVEEIIKHFYRVLYQPVRYASLFYTYYYLVEVERVKELRREFEKIRDNLWVAFYNYGIYSVGREIFQIGDALVFPNVRDEIGFNEMMDTLDKKVVYDLFNKELHKQNLTSKEINECFKYLETSYNNKDFYCTKYNDYASVDCICKYLDSKLSIFSDYAKQKRMLIYAEVIFSKTTWEFGGGEEWAKICRTLLRRNKVTKIMFIDACWSLQHATGTWLDRTDYVEGDESLRNTLAILDYNLKGNTTEVYKYANHFDPSLVKYVEYFK